MGLLVVISYEARLLYNAKEKPQGGTSPRFECILPEDMIACMLVDARNIARLPNGSQNAGEHFRDESWVHCIHGLNDLRVCLCCSWQYFLGRLSIDFDE